MEVLSEAAEAKEGKMLLRFFVFFLVSEAQNMREALLLELFRSWTCL